MMLVTSPWAMYTVIGYSVDSVGLCTYRPYTPAPIPRLSSAPTDWHAIVRSTVQSMQPRVEVVARAREQAGAASVDHVRGVLSIAAACTFKVGHLCIHAISRALNWRLFVYSGYCQGSYCTLLGESVIFSKELSKSYFEPTYPMLPAYPSSHLSSIMLRRSERYQQG